MPFDLPEHDSGHFGKLVQVKLISYQGQGSQFMKEAVDLQT